MKVTIITEKPPKTTFVQGELYSFPEDTIVLATESGNSLTGVCIKSSSKPTGYYSTTWNLQFKPFNGTISLES